MFGPGAQAEQDLRLDGKGNLVVARGVEDVRERVIEALRFQRGSWWLAASKGVPYRASIFVRPAFAATLSRIVGRTLLDVPGVATVDNVDVRIDRATRRMSYTADVTTDTGEGFSVTGDTA